MPEPDSQAEAMLSGDAGIVDPLTEVAGLLKKAAESAHYVSAGDLDPDDKDDREQMDYQLDLSRRLAEAAVETIKGVS